MIEKIISGGQTGADRAALDAAIKLDMAHGGWVPKGRLAEDGTVPPGYLLSEMPTDSYVARTEQNIVDSDGTLILSHGPLSGGSALTRELAQMHERPCLHLDLNQITVFKAAAMISAWISRHPIKILNVAGPRTSNDPIIYQQTKDILIAAFHKRKEKKPMPFDLYTFKAAYEKWATESLPDYLAHKMDEIVKKYPFVISQDVPWTPYSGKPSEQTFAVVTTGGLYLKDSQPPFDTESIHGDPSFREIPRTVRQKDLGFAHAHYDHSLAEKDVNTIFPIQRFIELEQEGIIGKLTQTHYSFSYVNDVEPLVTESIPELLKRIRAAGVHVLFLVPV